MARVRKPRGLRSDARPLYLQLVDALFDWIHEEGIRAGDRIPGEPELARRFEVGRSTVREALVYLECEPFAGPSYHFDLARSPTGDGSRGSRTR